MVIVHSRKKLCEFYAYFIIIYQHVGDMNHPKGICGGRKVWRRGHHTTGFHRNP
jgi:hypothetical protein